MELEEGILAVEGLLNTHLKEWVTPNKIVTLYVSSLTRQPIFPNLKFLSQSSLVKNVRNISS